MLSFLKKSFVSYLIIIYWCLMNYCVTKLVVNNFFTKKVGYVPIVYNLSFINRNQVGNKFKSHENAIETILELKTEINL